MSRLALAALSAALLSVPAHAGQDLVAQPSVHASKVALDRLEAIVKARGLKVFARIDHAAGAASIGETLRPTELILFGHPKGGTPLMKCAQSYGIDLPVHVLAWEDAQGKSWLGYRNLAGLGHAHPEPACDAALKRLTGLVNDVVQEAARE